MKLRIHPDADHDFSDAVTHYLEQSPTAASRFVEVVDGAYRHILTHPKRYRKEVGEVRIKVLQDFPYSIRYIERDDEILVLAVTHHARKPGHWQDRR